MPKNYTAEIKECHGKEYIKVFLLNEADAEGIKHTLEAFGAIKRANIGRSNRDLTVYPHPTHSAREALSVATDALDVYYSEETSTMDDLTQTAAALTPYAKSKKLYEDAIDNLRKGGSDRHSLDDVRLALERLLKEILGNDVGLEHQGTALSTFLKEKGATREIRQMMTNMLRPYYLYQDEKVKHDDEIKDEDVDYVIGVTNRFVRQLLKYTMKES